MLTESASELDRLASDERAFSEATARGEEPIRARRRFLERIERRRLRRREIRSLRNWLDGEAARERYQRLRLSEHRLRGRLFDLLASFSSSQTFMASAPDLLGASIEAEDPFEARAAARGLEAIGCTFAAKSEPSPFSPALSDVMRRLFRDLSADLFVRRSCLSCLCHQGGRDGWLAALEFLSRSDRPEEELFLRSRLARLVEGPPRLGEAEELLSAMADAGEPSEHVLMTMAAVSVRLGAAGAGGKEVPFWRRPLSGGALEADEETRERVGAAAFREMARCASLPGGAARLLEEVAAGPGGAEILRRFAIDAIERHFAGGVAEETLTRLVRDEMASRPLRRKARLARERRRVAANPAWSGFAETVLPKLRALPEGGRLVMQEGRLPDLETTARFLARVAQDDFGFQLRKLRRGRIEVRRGVRYSRKLWRTLHELRRPGPDKRQGYVHSIGRHGECDLLVPSEVLAELTPTKVPGEPVYRPEEGGWRPSLPLPSDYLETSRRGRGLELVTASGVTVVTPPLRLGSRLRARLQLLHDYSRFSRLRNDAEDEYREEMAGLGFRTTLRAFSLGAHLLPSLGEIRDRLESTWSPKGNQPLHLAILLAGLLSYIFGRSLLLQHRIRAARRRLPLVIGGWGTRGKSGTERLKTALFQALGYEVFSKTTGCEAMILTAAPGSPAREMYLYRPYEKATIWEHAKVMMLAARKKSQVFLWECMGLNPDYVEILARSWSRDDISTITNTYPDHEDIQGPAGTDIPRVMCRFIPKRGNLLTTEDQMLPILSEGCRGLGTEMEVVDDRDWDLVPRDLVRRFSYAAHPRNLALVLALARRLSVDEDFALKEMADRVVPDIGVLRSFRPIPVQDRTLVFHNACSANERRGFLDSFERLGLDKMDDRLDPGRRLCLVVNNRGDRIPRSRVFARIVAADLSAHLVLLIGTNLAGFRGYLEEALEEALAGISPVKEGASLVEAANAVRALLNSAKMGPCDLTELSARLAILGIPVEEGALLEEMESTIATIEGEAESAEKAVFARRAVQAFQEAEELLSAISASGNGIAVAGAVSSVSDDPAAANDLVRAFYRRRFLERVVAIEGKETSGDRILLEAARRSPPGSRVECLGMQNIKGPGLGLVYRCQSCEAALGMIEDLERRLADGGEIEKLLSAMTGRENPGETDAALLTAGLRDLARAHPDARERLAAAEAQIGGKSGGKIVSGAPARRRFRLVADFIAKFRDAPASRRRSRRATRVLEALADGRISHRRADWLLKEITIGQRAVGN